MSKDDFVITYEPLSLDKVYQLADEPGNGAVVVMSGMVRNKTDNRKVAYLDYQAYEPMALQVFKKIAEEIRQKWPEVRRVVIHHRIGKLKVGEISVLIAIGSPHRTAAFGACNYGIDALKYNAPIWKKEYWQDGASTWVT